MTEQQIEIFQTADGQAQIEVRFDRETIWLSQVQMAQLFDKDSDTIGLHLRNIFRTKELDENSTTEESSVVRLEGSRQIRRKIRFYNLDAIISVGYRVNSVLVAESRPEQKETIIRLIMNMLAGGGEQP